LELIFKVEYKKTTKKTMATDYPARGGQATPEAGTARILTNEEGICSLEFGIEKP